MVRSYILKILRSGAVRHPAAQSRADGSKIEPWEQVQWQRDAGFPDRDLLSPNSCFRDKHPLFCHNPPGSDWGALFSVPEPDGERDGAGDSPENRIPARPFALYIS